MNDSIAVIIPVYNTEKYLSESLDSVLQQTWTNLTIFAVDDGSTDLSGEILNLYAQKDCRVKVIHKTNEGVSSARNVALDAIQNSYDQFDFIHFFDSDDLLDKTTYEQAISLLNTHRADYAMLPVLDFDKRGPTSEKEQARILILDGQDENANFFFKSSKNYIRGLGNKIFRASFFSKQRFDSKLKTTEDQDVFLRLLPCLKRGITVPNQFLYYRLRKSSLTKSNELSGNYQVFSELHFHPLQEYTYQTNTLIFNDYVRALINNLLFALADNSPIAKTLTQQANDVLTQEEYLISTKLKRKLRKCLLPRFLAFFYVRYRSRKMHIKPNPYFFD